MKNHLDISHSVRQLLLLALVDFLFLLAHMKIFIYDKNGHQDVAFNYCGLDFCMLMCKL